MSYMNYLTSELRAYGLKDQHHISTILALGVKSVGMLRMQEIVHPEHTKKQRRDLLQDVGATYPRDEALSSLIMFPPSTPIDLMGLADTRRAYDHMHVGM